MADEIEVSDVGAVRQLTVHRAARRNSLTAEVVDGLREELERADADPTVAAVVLSGVGDHFSAGGDADTIVDAISSEDDSATVELVRRFDRLVAAIWTLPVPVVAAVAGVAYGAAFNIVLACDLVVCAADARFCEIFVRRGVVPDAGGAYLLPRLVGMHRAKELMLLATELDAERALGLGVVNEVVPDAAAARARALELGNQLAELPRFAIRQTKALVNASDGGTFEASLALEAITQGAALRSGSARQGFEDFLAKRSRAAG
jgi:2-(1,2-epoxy-1,2-dihydrophenyl)acetyl-CoA isomerase